MRCLSEATISSGPAITYKSQHSNASLTRGESLLHLDGAEGRVGHGGQGTQVEGVEGDPQEGCHGAERWPGSPVAPNQNSDIT